MPRVAVRRDDDGMARAKGKYEIRHVETGEVLSEHRTRQGAVDNWRLQWTGIPVQIFRSNRYEHTLVVEGTWHEATRPD
ncbi:MAG TPA: hypothetical protein VFA96_02870 [Nocardioides sp.]|nr:hypothetical protein [Nocardioides sp.]